MKKNLLNLWGLFTKKQMTVEESKKAREVREFKSILSMFRSGCSFEGKDRKSQYDRMRYIATKYNLDFKISNEQ